MISCVLTYIHTHVCTHMHTRTHTFLFALWAPGFCTAASTSQGTATTTNRKKQGWVIRRRRIIRRIIFITYLSVFFELLRIIRFWALNEFCSHKPPRAPQKHSQALKSPTEALPSPLEPPRGTPSPSERSMITCLLLPQSRRWCL